MEMPPLTVAKNGFFERELILFKNLTGFGNVTGLNGVHTTTFTKTKKRFSERLF